MLRFALEYVLPFGSLGLLMLLNTLFKMQRFNDWFDQWIIEHAWKRDSREVRGFEVKPITGQPPVLEEKEKNDHG